MNEFQKIKQLVNFKLMNLMTDQHLEMSSSASNITIVNSEGENTAPKQQPIL